MRPSYGAFVPTRDVVPRILVIVHARSIEVRSGIRSVVLRSKSLFSPFLFILFNRRRTIVSSLREIEIETESVDVGQLHK